MRRHLVPALLIISGFTASACSAFFVPNENDDGVQRCNTTNDCDVPDDNRHISVCVHGEGQPENSDKVCTPDFKEINCDPSAYSGDHPFPAAYADADDAAAAYSSCLPENFGKRGCPADAGACDSGLEARAEDGVCDEPGVSIPAIYPGTGGFELAGQDAADQFCRWYFCDEAFVCDTSGSKPICKPCAVGENYTEGGCGEIFIQGESSPIYTSLDTANCSGSLGTDEAEFGPAPVP